MVVVISASIRSVRGGDGVPRPRRGVDVAVRPGGCLCTRGSLRARGVRRRVGDRGHVPRGLRLLLPVLLDGLDGAAPRARHRPAPRPEGVPPRRGGDLGLELLGDGVAAAGGGGAGVQVAVRPRPVQLALRLVPAPAAANQR